MRIAIISDVHANLEALEKTVELIEPLHVDNIVCLGDVVGYGANPNECTSIVRQKTSHVLLGNHDQAACDLAGIQYFNPHARAAAEWTYEQLAQEHKEFLRGLPYTLELGGLFFVHASPYEPEAWHYILSPEEARDNLDHFRQPVCFVGHSHVALIFGSDHSTTPGRTIQRGVKYIINVGSVGQPRDGDWRLSFGVFDTQKWTYQNIRSEYDVQSASQKIMKSGLPRVLAERLFLGR